MILDNDDDPDEAGARGQPEDASGKVDIGRIELDASLHSTFPTLELASAPTESIDASGPWYDVEEGRYIEEPVPGVESHEQHSMSSAPAEAQAQTLPQSSTPLQNQTNQQGIGSITRSTSVEPALHSLPKSTDSGDDGWTDKTMAELEEELELALKEQQVEPSSVGTPTLPSPCSVKAPLDEIQSRERSETTSGRPEELQDAPRHGIPALELGEKQETQVVVPAVIDRQDLDEVVDADDPEDKEPTKAQPAVQPKLPKTDEPRFRLRGLRKRQLPGRPTKTTQYRVVWGRHPNRYDYWFNEEDVQISMPRKPYSQDLVPQVETDVRVCKMRSSRRSKGRKFFKYLVDELSVWITEDQLRISLGSTLLSELRGK